MPAVHRIRLRGPWQALPLSAADAAVDNEDVPDACWRRVTVPHRWDERPFDAAVQVRYQRRFNKPTGLEPGARVWLVIEAFGPAAVVELNGQSWPPCPADEAPLRIDIAERLSPANVLAITVSAGDTSTDVTRGFIGEVRLEIEEV